jgi:signal transduction histidine kinase
MMLKYSHEEILNLNILNLIIPEDVEKVTSELKELNSGKSIICELNLICKNGELIKVELSGKKLPDTRMLGIVRDITQRKIAERNMKLLQEAIECDKLKTEFFSNISHELRTPVNVIMSALQMCEIFNKEELLTKNKDKLKKYFIIMKQNCYRLIKLVNNLIDITRIDSGYLQLEPQNYNIVNVVEDITLSVVDYVENKGINLVFDTEVEEKIIACDPDKIERIILNLLSNSIKFTKPGGSIFINMKEEEDSIIISVKDTGIGIPVEKQKLVFERFVQVDKSLSRINEGSGIGLSLVKSLVEMHGGSIYLNSIPDMGSQFIIKLPVTTLSSSISSYNNKYINQSNTERINIEFSDIYS